MKKLSIAVFAAVVFGSAFVVAATKSKKVKNINGQKMQENVSVVNHKPSLAKMPKRPGVIYDERVFYMKFPRTGDGKKMGDLTVFFVIDKNTGKQLPLGLFRLSEQKIAEWEKQFKDSIVVLHKYFNDKFAQAKLAIESKKSLDSKIREAIRTLGGNPTVEQIANKVIVAKGGAPVVDIAPKAKAFKGKPEVFYNPELRLAWVPLVERDIIGKKLDNRKFLWLFLVVDGNKVLSLEDFRLNAEQFAKWQKSKSIIFFNRYLAHKLSKAKVPGKASVKDVNLAIARLGGNPTMRELKMEIIRMKRGVPGINPKLEMPVAKKAPVKNRPAK